MAWYAPDVTDSPKDPKLAAALTDAMAAMQHHQDQDAIARFSAILAKPDVPASASFPARFDRAMLYLRNFRYEDALADVNAALAISPTNPGMLGARALVRFGRADFAQALNDCNSSLAIAPGNPYLLRVRGNVAMETQRYDDAVRDYTSELQSNRDTGAIELRAVAYHRLGRESDAAADVALAVQAGAKDAKQVYEAIIGAAGTPTPTADMAHAPAAIPDVPSNGGTAAPTAADAHSAVYPAFSMLLGEQGRQRRQSQDCAIERVCRARCGFAHGRARVALQPCATERPLHGRTDLS
jgi:tetratricopeptide (TPR) repeat protein